MPTLTVLTPLTGMVAPDIRDLVGSKADGVQHTHENSVLQQSRATYRRAWARSIGYCGMERMGSGHEYYQYEQTILVQKR